MKKVVMGLLLCGSFDVVTLCAGDDPTNDEHVIAVDVFDQLEKQEQEILAKTIFVNDMLEKFNPNDEECLDASSFVDGLLWPGFNKVGTSKAEELLALLKKTCVVPTGEKTSPACSKWARKLLSEEFKKIVEEGIEAFFDSGSQL